MNFLLLQEGRAKIMCIFVGDVKRVSKTRILVVPLPSGRQLTVYENSVESEGKNAMVLPVPQGPVQLVDTSTVYPDVFKDCEALFPNRSKGGFGAASYSFGAFGAEERKPLPVERIGGYDVSVVPTLEDFARLSKEHFTVPDNIKQVLTENYGAGYSFVVCLFDKTVQAHPIAYISQRMPNGHLFIPTRHAHGSPQSSAAAAAAGALPIHVGVNCDYCHAQHIVGSRWKCIQCQDFDLCDTCYQTRRKQHFEHLFLHIAEPVQPRQQRDGFNMIFMGRDRTSADDWDHTIFIVNGALTAPPASYDAMATASVGPGMMTGGSLRVGLGQLVGLTGEVLSGIQHIAKVTITGGAYRNRDYAAVEYEA